MGRLITKKSECFGHFPLLIDVKERNQYKSVLKKKNEKFIVYLLVVEHLDYRY